MLDYKQIKKYRVLLDMTQKEIALYLGISIKTYSDLELGKPCKLVYYLAIEQYFCDKGLQKRMPNLLHTIKTVYGYNLTKCQEKIIFAIIAEHEVIPSLIV